MKRPLEPAEFAALFIARITNGSALWRKFDPAEASSQLARALNEGKHAIFVDWVLDKLLPNRASRFARQVLVRTVRRMLQLADGKVTRQARQNARHINKNPRAELPTSPSTISELVQDLTVEEAICSVNEVMLAVCTFFINRFPRLRYQAALDEIDIQCFSEKSALRPQNDVHEHVRGGKEGGPVTRYYVVALLVPALQLKLPLWYYLHSLPDPHTGTVGHTLPDLNAIVTQAIHHLERLPRLPDQVLLDRGFESTEVQRRFIELYERHKHEGSRAELVTPARRIRYGSDDAFLNPDGAELLHKETRRKLFQGGPMSPYVIGALAPALAGTVVADPEGLGRPPVRLCILRSGDPGAPTMPKGLTLILTLYQGSRHKGDLDAVALGQGWYAYLTYTTAEITTAAQAAHLAFTYRQRNYIESIFQNFRREFKCSGVQDMAARAFTFGLSLLLIGLWSLARMWRGMFVTPGRSSYSLADFLDDLYGVHGFADEPG